MSAQTHLVVGPPGTGKTHYLTQQAHVAADKHGRDGVAILSLTRTAAHNIAARADLPDHNVSTLHAACYRALGRPDIADTPKHLRAFSAEHPHYALSTTAAASLDETIDEPTAGQAPGDRLRAETESLRQRMIPTDTWTAEQQDFHATWRDYKNQTHTEDFTDLLTRARMELACHPAQPAVLLVDEAQDHSALELAVVRKWAAHTKHTVLAGDPHQAIYGFRGASPENLLGAEYATRRVLRQSYRVPVAVHAMARTWLAADGAQLDDYEPRDHPGHVRRLDSPIANPQALIDDLAAQTAAGRSCMVLATCGYMLGPLIAHLRHRGIPFANPWRPTHGAWNPMRSARRVAAYLAYHPDVHDRDWTWADLWAWVEILDARALTRGSKTLVKDKATNGKTARQAPSLEQLAEILGDNVTEHPATRADLDWLDANLLASRAKQMAYPLTIARRDLRALTATPALTVGTCHSVKGAEADVVYVAPDISRRAAGGWDTDPAARAAMRRLIYVALTRAREETVVLAPSVAEHIPLHDLETT